MSARMLAVSLVLSSLCATVNAAGVTQPCQNNMNDRAGAMTAKDWPVVASLAQRFISQCRDADTGQLGRAYTQLASAQLFMRQAKVALVTTETCIKVTYEAVGCHVQRAMALGLVGRMKEALAELDRVDLLVEDQVKRTMKAIQEADTKADRNVEEARLESLRASAELSRSLREMAKGAE